ncbi:MAG: hypothetical protein ACLVCH_13545 [Roseburia inulinivorans]
MQGASEQAGSQQFLLFAEKVIGFQAADEGRQSEATLKSRLSFAVLMWEYQELLLYK